MSSLSCLERGNVTGVGAGVDAGFVVFVVFAVGRGR